MKKYMVLCVAGQSNAVGYDESEIPKDYMKNYGSDRIFQLGLYDEDNLQVLCWKCNRKKGGNKTNEDVLESIDYGIDLFLKIKTDELLRRFFCVYR